MTHTAHHIHIHAPSHTHCPLNIVNHIQLSYLLPLHSSFFQKSPPAFVRLQGGRVQSVGSQVIEETKNARMFLCRASMCVGCCTFVLMSQATCAHITVYGRKRKWCLTVYFIVNNATSSTDSFDVDDEEEVFMDLVSVTHAHTCTCAFIFTSSYTARTPYNLTILHVRQGGHVLEHICVFLVFFLSVLSHAVSSALSCHW